MTKHPNGRGQGHVTRFGAPIYHTFGTGEA